MSLHFIMIGWDPWIKKNDNYLGCIVGNGVFKIKCSNKVF